MLDADTTVGVLGAGTMGAGIAQVALSRGHTVVLGDTRADALPAARDSIAAGLAHLVKRGKLTSGAAQAQMDSLQVVAIDGAFDAFAGAGLVIEAIVERLAVKRDVFQGLEAAVGDDAVLATNTSSLSVTAIAAACDRPNRVIGIHFFNPAPILPLVEIVPGLATAPAVVAQARALLDGWGKTTVVATDTPGFIVNRIARPFYGEALRILEEGIADPATIDWVMREAGGFRMGPFELMDLIGNDVNYAVSGTVFEAFGYDPRYRPSLLQKQLADAGRLGRKSGQGWYDHHQGAAQPAPVQNQELTIAIFPRILAMLINSAIDALFWRVASRDDIDLAMTRGVNYPKGLLRWADEIGLAQVLERLEQLQSEYGDSRYQPSPLLRRMVRDEQRFFS